MKLTKNTTPQALNYQCERCKALYGHKEMYNENYCYECYDDIKNYPLNKNGEENGR